ncbi:XRE family transcriptional regulator [Flavobacterium sp. 9AF]|uniref:helix-turn-helix domain-containing protein n=1 Tax=Flavobacterium sp. 9AF TaxID=2653142 RepID=UPI0012F1D14D|nr:helix-turn-helix transcriptional regulator [Flavobacterium sp. 9AF]VXC23304.1 XRE family transcriptional regulator [Flavobacterium sp. 9AF]
MAKQFQDKELLQKIILNIKQLRKSNNVTLETFYFDTGIHLARIEQGKTNITVSTLSKICSYFNISLSEFFKKIE